MKTKAIRCFARFAIGATVVLSPCITATAAVITKAEYSISGRSTSQLSKPYDILDGKFDSKTGGIQGFDLFNEIKINRDLSDATVTARARAMAGSVGVSLVMEANGRFEAGLVGHGFASGRAAASWSESSTVLVAGLPFGHPIFARFFVQLHVSQFRGATSGIESKAEMTLEITDPSEDQALSQAPYGLNTWGTLNFAGDSFFNHVNDPPGGAFINSRMLNGLPYTTGIGIKLNGLVDSNTTIHPGSAEISAVIHQSVTWGGLVSITDGVTGLPITDYKFTSESGFDYSRSFEDQVPEPSSSALLSFAFCVLLCRSRTQNRRFLTVWMRHGNSTGECS